MGWTICQPFPPSKQACKVYAENKDASDFAFAQVNIDTNQSLQDEETLSLDLLYEFLSEVDRDDDNVFLIRGKPIKPKDELIGLTDSDWIDCSSKQFQLDLDFSVRQSKFTQAASLEERVEIALDELPFLRDCGFIAQLSSSAGFAKTGKDDRLNLRLWVETAKAYTGSELLHHLKPYSHLIDEGMFIPNKRHYIRRAKNFNSVYLLDDKPHLFYRRGAALFLDEIKGYTLSVSSKKTLKSSKKTAKSSEKANKVKQTIRSTNRECLVDELNKHAKEGDLEGNRNEIFSELFRREALFNSGDCGNLIAQMLENPEILGDRDKRNLQGWEKTWQRRALQTLKLDAEDFRHSHFHSIHNFEQIDLSKRDWSDLLNYRASAIRSCMGTNKTKGVIYDLVRKAKDENKSVLIVTPLIAVTEQIAKDVEISHYHSLGKRVEDKKEIFKNAQQLATCYHSLDLYQEMGFIPEFDIVIIDEASQVFRAWTDPTDQLDSMQILFNILDKSKNALLLDADIDDSLCLWGLSRIANFAPETSALFYNSASYLNGYEITLEDNYGLTLQKILESIKSGKKSAIFTDFADETKTLSAFRNWLTTKTNKKIKAYDAELVRTRAPELKVRPNETISAWMKEDELDCLIVSPWCNCGWDYLERGFDFDEVFVISTGGFFSAQKIKQMLRRMRLTRKASVFLKTKKQAGFKDVSFQALKNEKGIRESDLTRLEAWQTRAKQAHNLDLVNVPWLLEELLKSGGALITKSNSSENEKIKGDELQTDWKDFAKEEKKRLLEQEETEIEKRRRVFSEFRNVHPEIGFVPLEETEIDQKEFLQLNKRSKKIKAHQARRFSELLYLDEDERRELDIDQPLQFNVLLHKLFQGFWKEIGQFVNLAEYRVLTDWIVDPKSQPISGNFEDIDLSFVNSLNYHNRYALREELPQIGDDDLNEPNRLLRIICNSFDLSFSSKNDLNKLPKEQRVSAIDARNNLFKFYHATKEKGYVHKAKILPKRQWCLKNVREKQAKGEKLSQEEQVFLMVQPKSFKIAKKKSVSEIWLSSINLVKKEFEDKKGLSFHHTRFCKCGCCEELKAGFSM